MTENDLEAIERALVVWKNDLRVKRLLVVGPTQEEYLLMTTLFPDAEIVTTGPFSWNLSSRYPARADKFDAVFIANTFMGSSDVELWLTNIFAVTDNLWMQDLIRAWRNKTSELSHETGDIVRFSHPPDHLARIPNPYDLTSFGKRLKAIEFYKGDSGQMPIDGHFVEMDSEKFVAWIIAPEKKKREKREPDVVQS